MHHATQSPCGLIADSLGLGRLVLWSPRANQDAMLPDVEEQRLHCILLPLLLHFPTVSGDS